MNILVRVVCDKRIGICYFIQRCHRYSLLPTKSKWNIPFKDSSQKTPLSLGHATSTARATLKRNIASRLLYFRFHFSSMNLSAFDLCLASLILRCFSTLPSRIHTFHRFICLVTGKFLVICLVKSGRKTRKFERKMARLLWKSL